MKYIVIKNKDEELMIVFPRSIIHSDMLKSVQGMRVTENHRDWKRTYRDYGCISAGFISPYMECYGGSESIGVESRPYVDTELFHRQCCYWGESS